MTDSNHEVQTKTITYTLDECYNTFKQFIKESIEEIPNQRMMLERKAYMALKAYIDFLAETKKVKRNYQDQWIVDGLLRFTIDGDYMYQQIITGW